MKILFVCKKRGSYGYLSSGLLNSVKFVTEMLNDMGVEAKMVEVTDNNSIDAEVTRFNPRTHRSGCPRNYRVQPYNQPYRTT